MGFANGRMDDPLRPLSNENQCTLKVMSTFLARDGCPSQGRLDRRLNISSLNCSPPSLRLIDMLEWTGDAYLIVHTSTSYSGFPRFLS
jgi:hypothetical protein